MKIKFKRSEVTITLALRNIRKCIRENKIKNFSYIVILVIQNFDFILFLDIIHISSEVIKRLDMVSLSHM